MQEAMRSGVGSPDTDHGAQNKLDRTQNPNLKHLNPRSQTLNPYALNPRTAAVWSLGVWG